MLRYKFNSLGVLAMALTILMVLTGCLLISAEEYLPEPVPEEKPSVLVVTLSSVHRMWPPHHIDFTCNNYTLDYGRGYVKTIDFNFKNRSFCYVQPAVLFRQSAFKCASVDDFTRRWTLPNPRLFPSQFPITNIAYEWVSGAWYFLDKQQRCLYMCDRTLQHCRILRRDIEDPSGLAVDPTPPTGAEPAAGLVFWSQNNTTPSRLVRSDLAGDHVKGLLLNDCFGPCHPKALTLDVSNKLLFWVDGETETVERSNYDGTGRATLYKLEEAYNLDIRVFSWFKNTLYLPGYRGIIATPLSPHKEKETYTTVNGFPSTALVYHSERQPPAFHPCAHKNGGCDQICVVSYNDSTPTPRCLCRHGYQQNVLENEICTRIPLDAFLLVSRGAPPLVEVRDPLAITNLVAAPIASHRPTVADVDTKTGFIYFFDVYLQQILRQRLDGTGREVFITDRLGECQGLAIDWMGDNLYWTDEVQGIICVARLSEPKHRREIVREVSYHPYSIILDPKRGVMFWTAWVDVTAIYGSIETANMDGTGRRKVVSEGVLKPNGLVLDMEKRVLYWCDTELNKIERLDLTSDKRSVLLAGVDTPFNQPYGLALMGNDLLLSEKGSGLLRRVMSGHVTLVETVTPPLFDIRIVSKKARNGTNACSVQNGGCAELCLATPNGHTCACAAGRTPVLTDPKRCGDVAKGTSTQEKQN